MGPVLPQITGIISLIGSERSIVKLRLNPTWVEQIGIEYHTPHKFHHDHTLYRLKRARVSQTTKQSTKISVMRLLIRLTKYNQFCRITI